MLDTSIRDKLRFCAGFLCKHGIDNGTKFINILNEREDSDPEFLLYKRVTNKKNDFFESMATQLRELWPKGMHQIGNKEYPWRDSIPNLKTRLETLWNERHLEDKYSIEDVLQCARRYLAQYEHNTKFMKLLKYFIMKSDTKSIGKRQCESLLADMLEGTAKKEELNEWKEIDEAANVDII